MRVAIHASKARSVTVNTTNYQPLTHHEAFYLATLGGAQGQAAHIQVWEIKEFILNRHVTPMVHTVS